MAGVVIIVTSVGRPGVVAGPLEAGKMKLVASCCHVNVDVDATEWEKSIVQEVNDDMFAYKEAGRRG